MKSALPQRTDPTGAHSPLERQNITESTSRTRSRTSQFRAAAALKTRAPSKCTRRPWEWARWATAAVYSAVSGAPSQRLWVFSRQTRRLRG